MVATPLRQLESLGQSMWLDAFHRAMLTSGEPKQLIDEDGLSGITANPSILEKAIAGSHEDDSAIRILAYQGREPRAMYEAIAVQDLRGAADLFRPTYDRTHGGDGFASLAVSPGVARDTSGTLVEARRLWPALDRPNMMIRTWSASRTRLAGWRRSRAGCAVRWRSPVPRSRAEARQRLARLPELGIDLAAVTTRLEDEGVKQFSEAFHRLLASLEERRAAALAERVDG
jgi:transaldolase